MKHVTPRDFLSPLLPWHRLFHTDSLSCRTFPVPFHPNQAKVHAKCRQFARETVISTLITPPQCSRAPSPNTPPRDMPGDPTPCMNSEHCLCRLLMRSSGSRLCRRARGAPINTLLPVGLVFGSAASGGAFILPQLLERRNILSNPCEIQRLHTQQLPSPLKPQPCPPETADPLWTSFLTDS